MDLGTEVSILLAYAFGIIILYVVGYILLVPVKIIWKLVFNSIIGGIALMAFNLIGGPFNVHIPVNLLSAVIVGFLGLPGFVLILIINKIILC